MVLYKSAVAALASVALLAAPTMAQAAPAKGSVMAKVSTVRADAGAKDASHLRGGGGGVVAVLAIIAIIAGILAATSGSSKPKSP